MDWVETKNSKPDLKRNYAGTCHLQILCPIPRNESSAEAGRAIVDLLTDKYGARACWGPERRKDAGGSGRITKP